MSLAPITMKISNREKILQASLALFNELGVTNVRLQQISDKAVVSLGNIGYHFSNKTAIVDAIYQDLIKEQDELLREYRVIPLFENIDRIWQITYNIQLAHSFFYLDTLEIMRAYPDIGVQHRERIQIQIAQIESILLFNESRGALNIGQSDSDRAHLARSIWMMTDLWMEKSIITQGEVQESTQFKDELWQLIAPYFTQIGRQEYDQMRSEPYANLI